MVWLLEHLLSVIIWFPAIGALAILLVKDEDHGTIRWIALGTAIITFALSCVIFMNFMASSSFQFVEKFDWVRSYGISYHIGIDGISLLLVMLTTFLMPVTILATYGSVTHRVKGFMVALLIMETGMIGVFSALDIFLFYIFWEAMLIPMYLLIGIWGGPGRLYASMKFLLYTMLGSLLMLVAIITIYNVGYAQLGHYTTDLVEIMTLKFSGSMQTWLFLAFGLSFAIKVPIFPFHTWLPDAHVEAPTAGSVILAGVLLKMGGYGFLRFCIPLFPDATMQFIPLLVTLGVIGIVYGALVAMVQTDIKKLVAYSSVSHLGFVVLGIFALSLQSVTGSVIQMINHGLSTGALFLLVGMVYERTHTRQIVDYGGLATLMPKFTVVFIIATLASIGMPGLNGFVGEFLIIVGSYDSQPVGAIIATSGVILSAVYLLWMVHRVFFGPVSAKLEATKNEMDRNMDLSPREWVVLIPVMALIVLMGVYPNPMLKRIEPSIDKLVQTYHRAVTPEVASEFIEPGEISDKE